MGLIDPPRFSRFPRHALSDPTVSPARAMARVSLRPVVGLLALLALSACGGPDMGEPAASASETSAVASQMGQGAESAAPVEMMLTQAQLQQAGVRFGGFDLHTFHTPVAVNGVLEIPPMGLVELGAVFPGHLEEIHILEGQRVVRGETLYTLRSPDYLHRQRDYLQARADLQYLRQEFDRQSGLFDQGAVPAKEFAKVRADLASAEARAAALRREMQLMGLDPDRLSPSTLGTSLEVRSPIDGIVTDVQAHVGQFIGASDGVTTLADLNHPHLELQLFERDLAYIEPGQPVLFRGVGDATHEYEAEVHLVGGDVDERTRSVSVHAHLELEGLPPGLALGSRVTARILTRMEQAPALPVEAVLLSEQGAYVFMVASRTDEGVRLERHAVRAGRSDSGHIQILDADRFAPDAVFMLNGVFQLATE